MAIRYSDIQILDGADCKTALKLSLERRCDRFEFTQHDLVELRQKKMGVDCFMPN